MRDTKDDDDMNLTKQLCPYDVMGVTDNIRSGNTQCKETKT